MLDPAHGGTDTGARGMNGIVEKDVVLQFARAVRAELERQSYRVVLARNDDSNPSYDDRAGMANAYRDAIFISLHVSSTGTPGSARAYYYQFWTPPAPAGSSAAPRITTGQFATQAGPNTAAQTSSTPPIHTDLISWLEAQRPYTNASRRLADGLQLQLSQAFAASPSASTGVEVRELRSVTAPAVAIELSSVAVASAEQLNAMAEPLATSIGRALAAYRSGNAAGAAPGAVPK